MIIPDILVESNNFKLMAKLLVDGTEVTSIESFFHLPIETQTEIKLFLSPIFQADLNKLNNEIEKLKTNLQELEQDLSPLGLPLYLALESILQDKRAFFEPGTATFKLKDGKFSKEVCIDPRDLICVYTPIKGRSKAFVVREGVIPGADPNREVHKTYVLNNNNMNYEEIKRIIDPISSRFVQISKNTLVNVAYFRFKAKDEIHYERLLIKQEDFSEFFVTLKGASELFEFVKIHWLENYSLQKRITDYMNGETGSGQP